ncbi:hypothetical protein PISMIDRAFT_405890 [Pisolithus microcarpus 441]|uniref:Uncharacterized protein n=1 Tax=Pisolithus microcarpus 441 TaxID=765257 RepID=A0A0C9YZT7_9AGAM|nr:hypothetical protein PISMIDRAFT_405890 [Pisolithus microcarpus 441]
MVANSSWKLTPESRASTENSTSALRRLKVNKSLHLCIRHFMNVVIKSVTGNMMVAKSECQGGSILPLIVPLYPLKWKSCRGQYDSRIHRGKMSYYVVVPAAREKKIDRLTINMNIANRLSCITALSWSTSPPYLVFFCVFL